MLHYDERQSADWASDSEVDRLFGLHDDDSLDSAQCEVEELTAVASRPQQWRGKRKRALEEEEDSEDSPSSSVSSSPPSSAVSSFSLCSTASSPAAASATPARALHPLFSSAAKPPSSLAAGTTAAAVTATAASASTTTASSILSAEQLESLLHPPSYYPLPKMSDFNQLLTVNSREVSTFSCSEQQQPGHRLAAVAEPSDSSDFIRVPSFALLDGGQHGPHISDHSQRREHYIGYWEQRLRKLKEQKPTADFYTGIAAFAPSAASCSSSSPPSAPSFPPLFAGVCCYFDGRQGVGEMSAHSLSQLLRLCGGASTPLLSRRGTTHIIACNLTLRKTSKEWSARWGLQAGRGGRRLMHVVRPEWIRDSIQQGKRLPEADFSLIRDGRQSGIGWTADRIDEEVELVDD